MKVAVIDLGTNTFNLLIADLSTYPDFKVLHAQRAVVKLGEGTIKNNLISPIPFERGIRALIEFQEEIEKHDVSETIAYATSGIRSALNGEEFILQAFSTTGIQIQAISGEREAELIYRGNRLAIPMQNEKHLIFDIGGGSNEFIIADSETIFYRASFPLGVARLLNKFEPEDPISETKVNEIFQYLDEQLTPLISEMKSHRVYTLIGSSGGFESVIDMIASHFEIPGINASCRSYEINLENYFQMSKIVRYSNLEQRKKMPGLLDMRRDMIVLTYLLIDHILTKFEIQHFKVSSYSLKEGMLAEWKEK